MIGVTSLTNRRATAFRHAARFPAAYAALLACLCAPLHAQNGGEPNVPEKAGKDLHAYRITGTPPRIDGRLDDETWALAERIDDLVQNEPDNMQAPSERTVVQIAYDDRYLYIAATCFVRDPADL